MRFGKHRGLLELPSLFIVALVCVILVFSVLQPITNGYLNNSTSGILGQTGTWNSSGYSSAYTVAAQLPLLFLLTLFISVALIVISKVGGL